MTTVAVILVLTSAFGHASWNLLAKRATTPEVFTWWMAMAATVIGLPIAVFLLATQPPDPIGWAYVGATIVFHTGYFTFLGRAYQDGDLSIVYPAARGLGITLVPVFAYFALGEEMSWPAALGVALVIVGITAVASSRRSAEGLLVNGNGTGNTLKRLAPGLGWALLTGVMIASYSTVDKEGVQHVSPLLYVILLTFGGGMGMLITLSARYPKAAFRSELAAHWRAIAAAGVLQTAAYGLVLFALRLSPVSYVAPFREIGIVFGVVLGALVLKEKVTRWRAVGAGLIAAGTLAIALAP